GGPGVGQLYTYAWDPGNPTVIAGGSTYTGSGDLFSNLNDGGILPPYTPYIVTVTNNTTNCSTQAQTVVLRSNTPIVTVGVTITDKAVCKPDGKIQVGNI